MIPVLYLGVDGGGSHCRARLESGDGQTLGSGLSGPASMRFGFDVARESIMAATKQALGEAGLTEDALSHTFAGIGLAGTGQFGAREALESWDHPFAGAWFEGDGYLALLGAFGGEEGGIVIIGTGSIAITYQEGGLVRVGGYGFPVSDEGSGADLGLNAVRHALRTLDGRSAPSAFSKDVLAVFANDPAAVIDWAEHASATEYARVAPLVVEHAKAGDEGARGLMLQAGAQIGELVEGLFQRGVPRVALSGGLAEAMTGYLPAGIATRLSTPQADAMAGGIMLAKQRQDTG